MAQEPTQAAPAGAAAAERDRLEPARILRLALRTLPYFRPLLRPGLVFLLLSVPLLPAGLYWGWTLSSVFWNGLLNARPLEPNQIALFGLDPAQFEKSAIASRRGIEPGMLEQIADDDWLGGADRILEDDERTAERKDALRRELRPQLESRFPQIAPADLDWERGRLVRAVLVPRLDADARRELARHARAGLAIGAGALALALGYRRRRGGWIALGALLLLSASLAPFFYDALANGARAGRPIQPGTARLFGVDPGRTTESALREARGFGAVSLEAAAEAAGVGSDALEALDWSANPGAGTAPERRELAAALEAQLAAAHPELRPAAVELRPQTVWRPELTPLLALDARRVLRARMVWFTAVSTALLTGLGIALLLYGIRLLQRVNQLLRVELLARMHALSLRYHASSAVGDSIYRLYQDSSAVLQLFQSVILQPFFRLLGLGVGIAALTVFSPRLTFGLLLVLGPMLWLTGRASRRLRSGFRVARETNSELTSRIQETLAAIKVIKAYGGEARAQARVEQASERAFAAAFDARSRLAALGIALFWLAACALVLGDAYLALESAQGNPTFLGAVIGFVGFGAWNLGAFSAARARLSAATGGFEAVMTTWAQAQDQAVAMDRVIELLALDPAVRSAPGAVPLRRIEGELCCKGVGFAYQPGRPVLQGVELAARPGTITAVIGATGSGKSTLMALLLRLYDPDEGSIEIDGRDLRAYQVDSVRDRIGIALQQNLLFGTSVRENIRYAVPDASEERVRQAAWLACADEFIAALPGGLDAPLGERGAKLSTGQRQRLSIARALIKDPLVLLLDEPTAALDAQTELALLERLADWGRERVILLVTHRLSTIRRADRIAYLHGGRVAELGSHAELMARPGGLYRHFVELEEGMAGAGTAAAGPVPAGAVAAVPGAAESGGAP